MIYILHGDDSVASRNRLNEILGVLPRNILDGKTLRVIELEENIVSNSLFGEGKGVVVENLLSKNPQKKDFAKMLMATKINCTLVFWDDKKLPKTTVALVKNAKVEEFMLPSFYFRFLDTFNPDNRKQVFGLYHELLKSYSSEQLFYSILKRIRQLVIISAGAVNTDISKMSPWQQSNLRRQVTYWNRNSLNELYNSLKDTEIKLKTGGLPISLSKHLDILILSKLT